MSFLVTIFTKNLIIVMSFFGVFVLCVLADILAKTFYNVNNLGEEFDSKKMLMGFLRMLCIAIASAVLAFVISIVPSLIPMVGIALSEETVTLFSVATISGVYLNGIIKYFRSAFDTINKIITGEKFIEMFTDGAYADEER